MALGLGLGLGLGFLWVVTSALCVSIWARNNFKMSGDNFYPPWWIKFSLYSLKFVRAYMHTYEDDVTICLNPNPNPNPNK